MSGASVVAVNVLCLIGVRRVAASAAANEITAQNISAINEE